MNKRVDDIRWHVIRAEFETGLYSVRELARKHKVSDTAINKQRAKVDQPGGPWKISIRKGTDAVATLKTVAKARGGKPSKKGLAEEAVDFLNSARGKGMTEDEARQVVAEMAVIEAADLIAEHNQAALQRVARLTDMFDRSTAMVELLFLTDKEAASLPLEEQERRKHAESLFMPGEFSSMSQALTGLSRLAESIQKQVRVALSMEGVGGKLPKNQEPPRINLPEREDAIDFEKLDTTQLEKLYDAALIVEGQMPSIPFLLPPGESHTNGAPTEGS